MQRLARIKVETINQSAIELFQHYDEIVRVIRQYLPPSTANLLARPKLISQSQGECEAIIEWYSDLEGQPILLDPKVHQTQYENLNEVVEQRLETIRTLTDSLVKEGKISTALSGRLTAFVEGARHNTKQLYSVNNEPVITGWGVGEKVELPPPPPPVAPVPLPTKPKHRWCCWLLPLLLLLAFLLGALWWFYCKPQAEQPPVQNVVQNKPLVVEPPKVAEPVVETPKVEEPIVEPPVEEPKIEEPTIEEPEVEHVVEATKPEPVKPTKTCVVNMKPEERPQMVIVFDDSYSMYWTLAENPQTIDNFLERLTLGYVSSTEIDYMQRAPNRLNTAKSASVKIINSVEKGIDIGLVALKRCPAADSYGFFSTSEREALKKRIKGMLPYEDDSGTPLYSGLKQAAAMVDGIKRDAFILIISDGEDNCKVGNVCSLAKQLAKKKPKLRINVVDIGGAKGANCAAYATKGQVFTANNPSQVSAMINKAMKPVSQTQDCN